MKTPKQLLLSIATVMMSLTIINCGGSSGGGGGSTSSTPAYGYRTQYGVSCGNNMITSQYGCLPRCGVSSVVYNGSCVPVAANNGYGTGIPGQTGSAYGNVQMCQGTCPAGLVSANGGTMCMPQGTCGACYAQMGGNCYIGDYAYQYYGYGQQGYGQGYGYDQGYGYGYY